MLASQIQAKNVPARTRLRWSATLAPVYALIWSGLAQAQQPAAPPGIEEQTRKNAASPMAADMGFDALREFWPEIARKLRIPFRERPPTDQQSPRL